MILGLPVARIGGVSASTRLAAAGLRDVAEKVEAGVRLDAADGLRLFETDDLLAVGYLALVPKPVDIDTLFTLIQEIKAPAV